MSQVVITINTDNAAFQDEVTWEVCSILTKLNTRLGRTGFTFDSIPLFDTNGNVVGSCQYVKDADIAIIEH